MSGHVPGARYLWVGSVAMANPEMSFEPVPVDQIRTTLQDLGVSNDSCIILCGVGGNVNPTARVFLTFEYLGMGGQTSILDGGFDAWKAEGKPVSVGVPKAAKGSFTLHVVKDVFVMSGRLRALSILPRGISDTTPISTMVRSTSGAEGWICRSGFRRKRIRQENSHLC